MNTHIPPPGAGATALDHALHYIERGWSPLPVPFRSKIPNEQEWQKLRITAETAPKYFNGAPQNIGIILGNASNGLSDVDLDCTEALRVATYFLPRTGATFGRASRRFGHSLYRTNLAQTHDTAVFTHKDPLTQATIVELRIGGGASGAQTVFPGSVHNTAEPIEWADAGEPSEVDGEELRRCVGRVAAAALLVRHWPGDGARHAPALALAGMLARGGWKETDARVFMEAVVRAASDPDPKDRLKAVETTFASYAAGKKTTGYTALLELMDARVVRRVNLWPRWGCL